MRGTAGRKHRGGTARNLNEEQENVYHGHDRRNARESTTDDALKVDQGSVTRNLGSRPKHPHCL